MQKSIIRLPRKQEAALGNKERVSPFLERPGARGQLYCVLVAGRAGSGSLGVAVPDCLFLPLAISSSLCPFLSLSPRLSPFFPLFQPLSASTWPPLPLLPQRTGGATSSEVSAPHGRTERAVQRGEAGPAVPPLPPAVAAGIPAGGGTTSVLTGVSRGF